MAEEAFEDFLTGVGATAVSEHGSKVARQDEATSNLFRDLDEQVEQARAVHSRPEEDANRIGKLCERLEYEASEVDALRSSRGEPVSHFRELVDSRQLMPGSCELNQLRPDVH